MTFSHNVQILVGALLGVATGWFIGHGPCPASVAQPLLNVLELMGQIFIGLLKMVLLPLVFSSIVVGVTNLKSGSYAKRIWRPLLAFFLCTPILAAVTGLVAANVIKPGAGLSTSLFSESPVTLPAQTMSAGGFISNFANSLFTNPVTAMAQNNILAVVVFALFMGIGLIVLGDRGRTLLKVSEELFELSMIIIGWIMKLAPLGILGLLAKLVASQDLSLFSIVGKYMLVVTGTTLFHGLITLPLILFIFTGIGPIRFFTAIREALLTAFATSSSSATLPVSFRVAADNLKIDKSISGVVLPLGATVNMDGTALYEAMAALFVANLCGIQLDLLQQVIVAITAMLASIGAPGIPSAGMVTMIMVLQSVGLPAEAVALLIPIDRPLDTIRTAVNVEGDFIGAAIVQKRAGRPALA